MKSQQSSDDPAVIPDVSVLVLAYNHEPYIAECLDGILRQDFTGSVEVLVGEDCSTDGTAAIVGDYARRFPDTIRVVTSSVNVGMHANNRRLIRAAAGRYIAYCEGDDAWHRPDKLRRQVELLDGRQDIVGVHSNFDDLIYAGGVPRVHSGLRRAKRRHLPALMEYKDLIALNRVQTCSVMLRTSVLKSYPESSLGQGAYPMEDWPMFLHALKFGPLLYMPESFATYRHTPGSMTRQESRSMVGFLRGERRLIADASGSHPEFAEARLEGLARGRFGLISLGVRTGEWATVQEAMLTGRALRVPEPFGIQIVAHAMSTPITRVLVVPLARILHALRNTLLSEMNRLRLRP